MVFPILFALALARIKKYRLKPLLKAYSLYPFAALTIVIIYLQISVFLHHYTLIKYATYIHSAYLFSLIIPLLVHKLFKPGLIGALLILIGTLLNKLAIAQNGGKMPVYATLSKLTGYYNETVFYTVDSLHTAGGSTTSLKFLTDYIDIGYSILSIGDMLIHSFVFIILFCTIIKICKMNTINLETTG
jgi:hypothetical protein